MEGGFEESNEQFLLATKFTLTMDLLHVQIEVKIEQNVEYVA